MLVFQAALFAAAYEATERELKRPPTDKEVAKHIGWSVKTVKAAREALMEVTKK